MPGTLLFGAFVTTTLFLTLAFPLSALSAYVLISRWVRWRAAAFGGALLYGFSPYLVAQGGSHLALVMPFFEWLLGRPPDARSGGISAWYGRVGDADAG